MQHIIDIALSNAASAAVLAVAAAVAGRFVERPAVRHVLWLVVLVRLFVPRVVELSVLSLLPSAVGASETASVLYAVSAVGTEPTASVGRIDPMAWVGSAWLIGALVVLVVAVVRLVRFRRVLRAGHSPSEQLRAVVAEVGGRLGVRRPPRVVVVDSTVPPAVWGAPSGARLVLPAPLLDRLGFDESRTLIGHELAHLKRRDHLVRYLELAASVVFWWHPGVWYAARRLRSTEEECCDQVVTSVLTDCAKTYARTLVETMRFLAEPRSPVPTPVLTNGVGRARGARRRIAMIMRGSKHTPTPRVARWILAAAVLVALALSPTLTARQQADTEAPELKTAPITLRLKDADIRDVLSTFSTLLGKEVLVDPAVRGKVTLEFDKVPFDQAVARLMEVGGLQYEWRGETLVVRPDPDTSARTSENPKRPFYHYDPNRDDMTEPIRISGPEPEYTEEAREQGVHGVVILQAVVDEDGDVGHVHVLRPLEPLSSGLTDSAVEAVRQWKFKPAEMDGEPVAVIYALTVKFALDETKSQR